MKNIKIICVVVFANMAMLLTSCGLTPCNCADAQLRNDTEKIKKCEEKVSKMTKEERDQWYKKEADCAQKQQ